MKSSFWAFGFVETKNGIIIAEIYFNKNKPWAYCPISLKEFRKDKSRIMKDLNAQIKNHRIFTEKEINKTKWPFKIDTQKLVEFNVQ